MSRAPCASCRRSSHSASPGSRSVPTSTGWHWAAKPCFRSMRPLKPAGMERIGAGPEFAATAVFPLETALASVSLLAAGIAERFPRLRILLSHGGGALSWILPRMDFGWSLGLKGQMNQPPSKIARQFWYDSILYDPASLSFLASAVGSDHIVVGSDYPFAIRQKQPGAFATHALGDDA